MSNTCQYDVLHDASLKATSWAQQLWYREKRVWWLHIACNNVCIYIYNIYIYIYITYIYIYTYIHIYIYVCVKIQMMLLIYPSMSTAGKFLTVSRSCTSSQKVSKVMLSCSEAWLIFFGYGDMWTMWIQYIIVHVDIHIYIYIYIYTYIYIYIYIYIFVLHEYIIWLWIYIFFTYGTIW